MPGTALSSLALMKYEKHLRYINAGYKNKRRIKDLEAEAKYNHYCLLRDCNGIPMT
jgi:hypothetical protein